MAGFGSPMGGSGFGGGSYGSGLMGQPYRSPALTSTAPAPAAQPPAAPEGSQQMIATGNDNFTQFPQQPQQHAQPATGSYNPQTGYRTMSPAESAYLQRFGAANQQAQQQTAAFQQTQQPHYDDGQAGARMQAQLHQSLIQPGGMNLPQYQNNGGQYANSGNPNSAYPNGSAGGYSYNPYSSLMGVLSGQSF